MSEKGIAAAGLLGITLVVLVNIAWIGALMWGLYKLVTWVVAQ